MTAVAPFAKHSWKVSEQSIPYKDQNDQEVDPNIRVNSLLKTGPINYSFKTERTLFGAFEHGIEKNENAPCLGWRSENSQKFSWISYKETLVHAGGFCPANIETFDPHTDYRSGTHIHIRRYFVKKWEEYPYVLQVLDRALLLGSGLIGLGASPHSTQLIGIFSQNRLEWKITELACCSYSMVLVCLHDTLALEQIQRIVKHCALKIIVVDKQAKVSSLLGCISEVSNFTLDVIVVMEDSIRVENMSIADKNNVKVVTFEDVQLEGQMKYHIPVPPKSENLCTICYTSGTTSSPKGVKLTHNNIISSAESIYYFMQNVSSIKVDAADVYISYLPMSHIFERLCQVIITYIGARIGFFHGEPQYLIDDLKILRPTVLPAIPSLLVRFHEMIFLEISQRLLGDFLIRTALKYKFRLLKKGIIKKNTFWDKSILGKVRQIFGGKVRLCIVGSGPISSKIIDFMRALGMFIVQGYGLTETSGIISIGHPLDFANDSVGAPMLGNIVKLVDVPEREFYAKNKTGEICVKGPNIFSGYYKDPKKNREVMDNDGWLHTGDIGMWLPNGALKVFDRVHYTFKIASGHYITPEKIESVLTESNLISQAYIHGSEECSYIVAVVVPALDDFNVWSLEKGFFDESTKLFEMPIINSLFFSDISANWQQSKLKSYEYPKKIFITEERFSLDNEMLTALGKPRRLQIYKRFKKEIDKMLVPDRNNLY